ncbi:uncharacterized protein LOC112045064 isoform X2 [Bicyclus anynana]|uniref:Uncharacterized protein LOC112045064 isoform X2 n=1 Tax=Bicyclus anynana TaxID=110368 RepID=A0ABM3LHL5_BICAN|nr:uncharacterized protein LOC112045064 isoform X2 [Bicyclus anynana]
MPKLIELTIEIEVQKVSCPGVWLCQDGRVSLTVFALGTSYQTCYLPPIFPLAFRDVFYFRKRFQESCALNNICCLLKDEIIYCELVQWSESCAQGRCVTLAQYLGALGDVLFPPQMCSSDGVDLLMRRAEHFPVSVVLCHARHCESRAQGRCVTLALYLGALGDVLFPPQMCSSDGVDLLMRRAEHFPGILSPKIEISTKVRIDEVWNTCLANNSISKIMETCHCPNESEGSRQKQVCHSSQYHRATSKPQSPTACAGRRTLARPCRQYTVCPVTTCDTYWRGDAHERSPHDDVR